MTDTTAPLDEITAFITYVSRLATSDAVRRRVAGAAERLVTPAESAALRAVADAGPVTFKGLAEHLELDQTTISRTANRLLEVGLVARETDPDDRRKAWLTITTDGDEMLHRLQHVATQWYEVAIVGVDTRGAARARRRARPLPPRPATPRVRRRRTRRCPRPDRHPSP